MSLPPLTYFAKSYVDYVIDFCPEAFTTNMVHSSQCEKTKKRTIYPSRKKVCEGVLYGHKVAWGIDTYPDGRDFLLSKCSCGKSYIPLDPPYTRTYFVSGENTHFIPKIHIRNCDSIAAIVRGKNPIIFAGIVKYHLNQKLCTHKSKKIIELSRSIDPDLLSGSIPIYSRNPPQDYSELCQKIFDGSVSVNDVTQFPESKGIYFIRYLNKDKWDWLYIGIGINLNRRWQSHHRQKEIALLSLLEIPLEFSYSEESSLLWSGESVESLESKLIKHFNPKLNRKPADLLG
jgi:hypothetical protein